MSPRSWCPSVVVAMPCYDEERIADFVDELQSALDDHVSALHFVIVDDCSPNFPPDESLQAHHGAHVRVERNAYNVGHGPSVMNAYAYALALETDVVVHVDGDGQFSGESVLAVVQRLVDADVAVGERTDRPEAWYRGLVSSLLSSVLRSRCGVVRDVNTPLRAYRRGALKPLCETVPPLSAVPHVMLTLRMANRPLVVRTVPVQSRPRLGQSPVGTMWGTSVWSRVLPSRRFLGFCARAAMEVVLSGRHEPVSSPVGSFPARAAISDAA